MTTRRILLVDDDIECLRTMELLLTMVGHGVRTAATGQEALAAIRAAGVDGLDLVVTDLRMPGMSGMELLQVIREAEHDLPVLIFTAFREQDSVPGDLPCLDKPFSTEEFLRSVDELLAETRRTDPRAPHPMAHARSS